MNILEFIPVGRENAISCRELSDLLHIPKRQVTRQIERERRHGCAVCASNATGTAGYYRPADRGELREYLHRLNSRITEIQTNRDGLQAALDAWRADTDG